ncbi:MAG: hypothetical protein AB1846_16490, partial [Chloroflexota bacterium]
MKPSKISSIRNKAITGLFLFIALFIMATPALANSSSWYFLAYYDGRVINGKTNGVYHQMTAGALTISGTIKTTAVYGNPPTAKPWYFEVRKWSNNKIVCKAGPIAVPLLWNQTKSFSKACGSIPAGKYYLKIWRAAADDREVTGSGSLMTK